ncbi:hypothetical protein JD79_04110 [Geodermatophilus normandii]|uniref:Uncharacterized protein n=1 Tax=Geodermatophilus normandii TaxID=1137989 RepID=A0A317QMU6_9ACTN|nr:hypothetical protein [Geodermatophilus normandii]PWW24918.1 hypothetical protein JD79_04110 [Geodermatophilus normandii]
MTTPFNQDDLRERAMVSVLNLEQRSDRGRQDEDAHLDIDWHGRRLRLLFELKSAAVDGDFGTGRDTGIGQLRRWANMHFVFGWFAPRDNVPKRLWYGSPAMMREWNRQEQAYLAPDLALTSLLPDLADKDILNQLLGHKDVYTYDDLHALMKDHWNAKSALGLPNRYITNADVRRAAKPADCLYSPEVAMQAVRDRAHYLLARGSTVNNRKISRLYVMSRCQEITGPQWALNLHRAVMAALEAEPPRR